MGYFGDRDQDCLRVYSHNATTVISIFSPIPTFDIFWVVAKFLFPSILKFELDFDSFLPSSAQLQFIPVKAELSIISSVLQPPIHPTRNVSDKLKV